MVEPALAAKQPLVTVFSVGPKFTRLVARSKRLIQIQVHQSTGNLSEEQHSSHHTSGHIMSRSTTIPPANNIKSDNL
eukprot:3440273-Amphidinium_carterae.2